MVAKIKKGMNKRVQTLYPLVMSQHPNDDVNELVNILLDILHDGGYVAYGIHNITDDECELMNDVYNMIHINCERGNK